MTEGNEPAANSLTGVIAHRVEPPASGTAASNTPGTAACRNCGAALASAYCAACGQRALIHRSVASLGHEVLHSVFHFEGKIWRTLPELAIHPGRLTRRYISGERAKFISPMTLYLFMVFLMYAVFSLTGGSALTIEWRPEPGTDRPYIADQARQSVDGIDTDAGAAEGRHSRVERAIAQLRDNPRLVAFKIETNGYKFSWLLVPLSIPFVSLLFWGRRDLRLYDHAVFVTYSIAFMMMLAIAASLLGEAGIRSSVLATGLQIAATAHMYRHLRGAYGLSRRGAVARLLLLLIAAAVVLAIFVSVLLLLGVTD